jgi:peptide-methionine (S)-S-oxide reductase
VVRVRKNSLQGFVKATLTACLIFSASAIAEEIVAEKAATAIFAGGCFWCMESPFDDLPGVIKTISGYTGGHTENPTYKEVSNGKTGHLEAVQVTYDPAKVTYEKLLEVFWRNIDPFDDAGQFCDKGDQYKAAIFYNGGKERQLAEASKTAVKMMFTDKLIATSIIPAGKFFPAEDYHQDYYLSNPKRYKFYRFTCGRDRRLNQVWNAV